MSTSPDTVLRLLHRHPVPKAETPRVLGIDDWAWRKGRSWGTILIDLETRRPIDLLPERTSTVVAAWLRDHPGVEVVARDRSTEYARAITEGAPDAAQVADPAPPRRAGGICSTISARCSSGTSPASVGG